MHNLGYYYFDVPGIAGGIGGSLLFLIAGLYAVLKHEGLARMIGACIVVYGLGYGLEGVARGVTGFITSPVLSAAPTLIHSAVQTLALAAGVALFTTAIARAAPDETTD